MKFFSKWRKSTIGITLLFAAAILLLGVSAISGVRAALTVQSEVYSAEMELKDIGVTLTENDIPVSRRNFVAGGGYVWDETTGPLLAEMLAQSENVLKLGFPYEERFAVTNSGRIDEYVRVRVYRYWARVNEQGKITEKLRELDPSLIELEWDHLGSDWILDSDRNTTERCILYYNRALPVGERTEAFTKLLTIDPSLPYKVTQTTENGVITTVYDYGGVTFQVEIEVDAVQTHSGRQAIQSAWGLTDEQLSQLEAAGLVIG